MKSVSRHFKKTVLLLGVLLTILSASAQPAPEYSFSSPVLLSGVDRTVGAVYRFSAVKTNTDAIVTITAMVNASLSAMDRPAAAGGGYDAAFQPNVTINSMTTGYVEFSINFVITGGVVPVNQGLIHITALDIDGYDYNANLRLWEFEQFDLGPNPYVDYELAGPDLAISYIGNAVRGTNVGGDEYGGINTSQNVRFTMYKSNLSGLTVRSGAINNDQFNNVTRQRSFYFARFSYPNSAVVALSVTDLIGFSGKWANGSVNLDCKLAQDHTITKVYIERGTSSNRFERIGEVNVVGTNGFRFNDQGAANGKNFYRLALYETSGRFAYSKILTIDNEIIHKSSLQVYPTLVKGSATLAVSSDQSYKGTIQIADLAGRILSQRAIAVPQGTMVVDLQEAASLKTGTYVVILNSETERLVQRIIVQ
jgi:hypothetical protein